MIQNDTSDLDIGTEPLLRSSSLFANLIDEDYETLALGTRLRTYAADAALFYEHDEGGSVFLILEGAVSIERTAESDRGDPETVQIALRGPGDLIGELSLFEEAPRNADARAIESTTALQIRGKHLFQCAQQSPELALNLLRLLADKLREATDRQAESRLANVRTRVLRALTAEGRLHGSEEAAGTRVPLVSPGRRLTQGELALQAGCDRAVLNRTLATLEQEGFIERDTRSILVRRILRSQAVAGTLLRAAKESASHDLTVPSMLLKAAPKALSLTPAAFDAEIERLVQAGIVVLTGTSIKVRDEAKLSRLASDRNRL
jgi:CRP-like cAMP-binding protein